jgi:hypothetical protein
MYVVLWLHVRCKGPESQVNAPACNLPRPMATFEGSQITYIRETLVLNYIAIRNTNSYHVITNIYKITHKYNAGPPNARATKPNPTTTLSTHSVLRVSHGDLPTECDCAIAISRSFTPAFIHHRDSPIRRSHATALAVLSLLG